jgi:hypothetical protein
MLRYAIRQNSIHVKVNGSSKKVLATRRSPNSLVMRWAAVARRDEDRSAEVLADRLQHLQRFVVHCVPPATALAGELNSVEVAGQIAHYGSNLVTK